MAVTEGERTTRVATYERVIAASVTRIWENVLDWEHLPWLHRGSFGTVRLLDESARGWRAWVTTRPRTDESRIEVELDRAALRYVTRTTDGAGAGSEVWTRLEPCGARSTRIRVELRVPPAGPELDANLGKISKGWVRLYSRLWDEDEAMMIRRQQMLDESGRNRPRHGIEIPLGPIDELRKRLPLVVRVGGNDIRLVSVDGEILTHPTRCPHLGGPLDEATVEDGCITCPWHGYRYDLRSGRSCDGRALELGSTGRVRLEETSEATLVE